MAARLVHLAPRSVDRGLNLALLGNLLDDHRNNCYTTVITFIYCVHCAFSRQSPCSCESKKAPPFPSRGKLPNRLVRSAPPAAWPRATAYLQSVNWLATWA